MRTKQSLTLLSRQRRRQWERRCYDHTDGKNNHANQQQQQQQHPNHHYQQQQHYSTNNKFQYDMKYVNTIYAPSNYDVSSAVVYPNVITDNESNIIIKELIPLLKRRRYEKGHWDSVILKYKEIELQHQQNNENENTTNINILHDIIHRIRNDILIPNHTVPTNSNTTTSWLPCHVIDLHQDGELNAHVDSTRYSGNIVAGLSFQCNSIMRLRPSSQQEQPNQDQLIQEQHKDKSQQHDQDQLQEQHYIDLLLPMNSLYVLSGMSRYSYTHELLSSNDSYQSPLMTSSFTTTHDNSNDMKFRDTNRISIIFRDAKQVEV